MKSSAYQQAKEAWVKRYLEELLAATGGNVSQAAREAGIDRANLLRLMRARGIKAADYRAPQAQEASS